MQRTVEIEYRPPVVLRTEPPQALLAFFAPRGIDVVFDSRDAAVIVERHTLGREPIVSDELPEEVLAEIRGMGYKIDPQDHSIVLGDGCFYKQPVEQRNQLRAERAEEWRRIDANEPLFQGLDEINQDPALWHGGRSLASVRPTGEVPNLSGHARPGNEMFELMARAAAASSR